MLHLPDEEARHLAQVARRVGEWHVIVPRLRKLDEALARCGHLVVESAAKGDGCDVVEI